MSHSLKFASDKKFIFIGLKFPITCNFFYINYKIQYFQVFELFFILELELWVMEL
jgi:hypothetical protein